MTLLGSVTMASSEQVQIKCCISLFPWQDGSCRVAVSGASDDNLFVATPGDMEIVAPKKNDKVKILHGEFRGSIGKLIGIDGVDGIVKIGDDVRVLEMDTLGKLVV